MHMLILKLVIVIVFLKIVLKLQIKHLQIHQQKDVFQFVQHFLIYMDKLKLLLAQVNALIQIMQIQSQEDVN
jgi:hypothetical protein